MPDPRIIIVTGANRGIGQAICKLILQKPHIGPIKLFATSRKGEDLGFAATPGAAIVYPKLDISDRRSVAAFAEEVQDHGDVDVLINNAGVNLDAQYGYDNAKRTLDVNYWGMSEMCRRFMPLLSRPHGRVVNLSSVASSLSPYSETIQARFRNPNAKLDDLDELAKDYLEYVRSSTEVSSGFGPPSRSYSVSKGLVNALTMLLARDNPDVTINCCCPGWISTDMGRLVGSGKVQPPKTPEDGARIPVRLAFEDLGGVSGKYWANSSVRSREEGSVQEW